MRDLTEQVKERLAACGIGSGTDRQSTGIIVGVSGGADSVCLLVVLCALAQECGLLLTAVHVHHGIRGAEADRDERFVHDLCERLRVPYIAEYKNVPELAARNRQTLEEAGRQVRYETFERLRQERNADWIAVAHHREDQAETILLNLFRGSGLRGMGGIRPVQGRIIRPLFDVSRQQIEAFLKEKGFDWIEDSTNLETDASRNLVRLKILPEVREKWPEAAATLCQSAERFAAAQDYMQQQSELFMAENGMEQEERLLLPAAALGSLHPALRDEVLYTAVCRAAGRRKDITARHIQMLVRLLEGQSGRQAQLPYGITVYRSYDWLIFGRSEGMEPQRKLPEVKMRIIPARDAEKIAENDCTKHFSYDKIDKLPVWRFRQPGDRIALYADGRGKKLQDFFTDRKIPAARRDQIPVLALGTEILWIMGLRVSSKFRVTEQTRQVLVVTVSGQEAYTDR